jgi:hypothetical protein
MDPVVAATASVNEGVNRVLFLLSTVLAISPASRHG